MKIARTTFIGAAAALIAGCASTYTPPIVSAGNTGVSYRIQPDRLEDTRKRADEYCAERGRTDRLQSVTPTGDGTSVVVFSCV